MTKRYRVHALAASDAGAGVRLAGVYHLTDGFGRVEDLAYAALLALPPQLVRGTATRQTRLPSFAALLILARHHAMLLPLDGEPGQTKSLGDSWPFVSIRGRLAP